MYQMVTSEVVSAAFIIWATGDQISPRFLYLPKDELQSEPGSLVFSWLIVF